MTVNAVVFALIFIAVARNNRLAADDFHYLVKTRELGIWNAMRFYYENWNPRWSATLVTDTVLKNYSSTTTLLGFHLCSLMLAIASFYAFVKALVTQMKLPLKNIQALVIAMYLAAVLFYGSFSRNDTWFWLTVNPMYFWGSFAAVLGGSLVVLSGWKNVRTVLVAILFLYAGGASETVAITSLVTLFFLGIITDRQQFAIQLDRSILHVATVSCLIGFGIDLLGAGVKVRFHHLPQLSVGERILVGLFNYIKFTLIEIPRTLPVFMLGMAPFAFLGRKHLRFQLITWKESLLADRKLWILSDLLVFIFSFSMAFSMGEMGPKRAWFPLSFIVLLFSLVFAYQLGTYLYIRTKGKLFQLVILSQVVAILAQLVLGVYQIRVTSAYAAAVDERMELLSDLEQEPEIIELEPLPNSGWLFSAEISTDTAHFTNKQLSAYFGGNNTFVLKDTLTSSQ